MDDLTKEFLVESREGLDRMERCLTELEQRPDDTELLAEIFRAVHTIKGTTGFLALPRLETLAHAGEHLLGRLRDAKVVVTRSMIDGLLALLDGLRNILGLIERTGGEGSRKYDSDGALIALLKLLGRGDAAAERTSTMTETAGTVIAREDLPASVAQPLTEQTLRMDVDTLNRMMNLVGELVLTRNQILLASGESEVFQQLGHRLDAVTIDLRETVMRARTQPVGNLFQRFPRMVRDVAQACGRCVRLDFAGQETRLDKSLLEALKDPLTHAIRNAIDHGIEPPAERVRAGKALEGTVRLMARHEGGQVVIEVCDDGGGIDRARVLQHAVQRGVVSAERAQAMSEAEVLDLVFAPGFSTRDEVTMVSGRGVGMDVVRAGVESVGGSVEVDTRLGEGTTLRMRVPLTLAIVPALVVRCGGALYAVPRSAVSELMLVMRREEASMVQRMGEAKLLRLREELLPLLSLSELLGIEKNDENGYYVAVLEAQGRRFGLIVDDLLDPQEIVVKPLARVLRGAGVFSGASVLGGGELALILDIAGVVTRARMEPLAREDGSNADTKQEIAPRAKLSAAEEAQGTMLVFESFGGERRAMRLEAVERIERIARESVEFCAGEALLQYRGGLLPLEDEDGALQETNGDGHVTVVICRRDAEMRSVGLVVRRVLDIAGGALVPQSQGRIALVHKRLAAVQKDFESQAMLQEVA